MALTGLLGAGAMGVTGAVGGVVASNLGGDIVVRSGIALFANTAGRLTYDAIMGAGSVAVSGTVWTKDLIWYGGTGFITDIQKGDTEAVKKRLETITPEELNSRDIDQNTALMVSILENRHTITHLLIEAGAQVNLTNPDSGQAPLHLAILRGQVDVIEALVKKGADKQRRDKNGNTPRAYASTPAMKKYADERGFKWYS